MNDPFVSVIVPVLNDTEQLEGLLSTLPQPAATSSVEIIVVNGAARDLAMEALQTRFSGVRWTTAEPGRACQMNHGAGLARGRWLLFLHADCRLARGWDAQFHRADDDPRILGGSFRFTLDAGGPRARMIEWGVAQRVRWFGLPFGDQALFVRQEVFRAIGGYRALPLMEDVDLVRQIKRRGRLWHADLPVRVSARRWRRDGWIRRSAENVLLVLLFLVGVAPDRLARIYHRHRATTDPPVGVAAGARSSDESHYRARHD